MQKTGSQRDEEIRVHNEVLKAQFVAESKGVVPLINELFFRDHPLDPEDAQERRTLAVANELPSLMWALGLNRMSILALAENTSIKGIRTPIPVPSIVTDIREDVKKISKVPMKGVLYLVTSTKTLITLCIKGNLYRLEYEELSHPLMKDGDYGQLDIFSTEGMILSYRLFRKVNEQSSFAIHKPIEILGFIDGDWIDDFVEMKKQMIVEFRNSQIGRRDNNADKPKEAISMLKSNFGIK